MNGVVNAIVEFMLAALIAAFLISMWAVILSLAGCGMSATSQRASQASEQTQRQETGQATAQGMQHTATEQSVPIIINCVQIFSGRKSTAGPCFERQGQRLPGDKMIE